MQEALCRSFTAEHFADNITRAPIRWLARNHNIFNDVEEFGSYVRRNSARFLSDLSSPSVRIHYTRQSCLQACERLHRIRALAQFKEGHGGEHTNTEEE